MPLKILKNSKSVIFSFENGDLPISNILRRLTASRIIDQFGRKRYQKKHKDVGYTFLSVFFHTVSIFLNI